MKQKIKISIITPTFNRHKKIPKLLKTIFNQTLKPFELIIIDCSEEKTTENWITKNTKKYPFFIKYFKSKKGTAIQRNIGIENSKGNFIAFIDDDVQLAPNFFMKIINVFENNKHLNIGGITGYKINRAFNFNKTKRWIWYKKLSLLSTYEPGTYDKKCGYPINIGGRAPFSGTMPVDFMTGACTIYLKKTIDTLRFNIFFKNFGILEDCHFSLLLKKKGFKLLQCGDALCTDEGQNNSKNFYEIGKKTCVNYYFVFQSLFSPLSKAQKFKFFRFQLFELFRFLFAWIKKRDKKHKKLFLGKLKGIFISIFFKTPN